MSGFRRTPNVSQYIANLNNPDMATSPTSDYLQDDSLGTFDFSTDFFDFDMGQNMPSLTSDEFNAAPQPDSNQSPTALQNDVLLNSDFTFPNDFTFPPVLSATPDTQLNTSPSTLLPNPLTTRPSPTAKPSPTTPGGPKSGDKRKHDALQQLSSSDVQATAAESARVAAEEDKRRRNTAASARFRIKKKQREQALEKTAKEMTEKAATLETKVQQLEMENKWLKSLITEKTVGGGGGGDDDDVSEGGASESSSAAAPAVVVGGLRTSKRDLEEMWRRHQNAQERSVEPDKGVGTTASKKAKA